MNEFPDSTNPLLGVRFHPTDEDLICYLIKFVCSKNYFCDDIQVEDLYGSKKPGELLGSLSDPKEVKYFFTKLKKKKSDHTNYIRTLIGGGKWRGLDKGKSVGPKCVGIKKTYRYVEKKCRQDEVVNNVSWIMREYSLDEKVIKSLREQGLIKNEDVVLCYIKVKQSGNHMPKGNDDADVVTEPMLSSTQQRDDQLQQDQNSAELVMNQVQSTATEPQWPIYSDELSEQIVMCPSVLQSSSDYYAETTSTTVIKNDKCFSMDELADLDTSVSEKFRRVYEFLMSD